MRPLNPPHWPRPKGYSNGIEAEGRIVFVAGMVGWDADGRFPADFPGQFRQALENTLAVLSEADAGPHHITRMTWFIKGLDHYRDNIPEIGRIYRELIGKNFPAMAVIGVSDLVEPDALLEIETTAVL